MGVSEGGHLSVHKTETELDFSINNICVVDLRELQEVNGLPKTSLKFCLPRFTAISIHVVYRESCLLSLLSGLCQALTPTVFNLIF